MRDTKLNHLAPAGNAGNRPLIELGHVPKQHFDSETHLGRSLCSSTYCIHIVYILVYISHTLAVALGCSGYRG